MIFVRIALRNLTRQKRRTFLLGGALAFSVLVIVMVNSLAGGIQASLARNISDLVAGHIFFTEFQKGAKGQLISTITDDQPLIGKIKETGLKYTSLTRRTMGMGTLIYINDSATRQLSGVNWQEETAIAKSLQFVAGSAAGMNGTTGILISTTLAEALGIIPGEKLTSEEQDELRNTINAGLRQQAPQGEKVDINLLNKQFAAALKTEEGKRKQGRQLALQKCLGETVIAQLTTIHGQQNVGEFQVQGIFTSQIDSAAYVDRRVLNTLLDMPAASYNFFGIYLADSSNLTAKTDMLYQALKASYDIYPVDKIAGRSIQSLQGTLQNEKFTGSKAILTNLNNELGSMGQIGLFSFGISMGLMLIILPIIMIGIYNTYRIIIFERTREIGTMRALGTHRKQVRDLFLLEAGFLSLAGLVSGSVLAYLIMVLLRIFDLSGTPGLALFLDKGHLAYTVDPSILFISLILICGFTLLAAFLPSRWAARLLPAHALGGKL